MKNRNDIAVFVHLALNKDVDAWRKARDEGRLVGINDETPYGYGRAEGMGCTVCFSKSQNMGLFVKSMRLVLRGALGFDIVHSWMHRNEFSKADVIWTHTESQFLAVAATLLLTRQKTKLLGQVVWLMDNWKHLTFLHKWLYRRLIRRVDVMTFLSTENFHVAQTMFPGMNLRIVPFGIPSEDSKPVKTFQGKEIRVLALGNDRHRDWETLVKAVSGEDEMSLVILSGSAPRHLTKYGQNISIRAAHKNDELHEEFKNADVVCVPLKPNLHASGITVIQEAVLYGVPVIATDVGGLDLYFSGDEISYVPVGNVLALRAEIRAVMEEPEVARSRAITAQARMADYEHYGAQAYIAHHVAISRELLGQ